MNILLLPNTDELTVKREIKLTDRTQVQHVNKVLRAKVGDSIKVGIKQGRLGTATLAQVSDSAITLTDICCQTDPPAKLPLTLVLALPRPKVLRRLMMDMTAIGVSHIVLINSYRTDKSYWQSPMLDRLDEFVKEGLQQGCDTIPPKLTLAKRFKPFVQDDLPALLSDKQGVVCHLYGDVTGQDVFTRQSLPEVVCIGAEGGWIDYEVGLLVEQGVQAVSLGERILRCEAAVNAICGRYLP